MYVQKQVSTLYLTRTTKKHTKHLNLAKFVQVNTLLVTRLSVPLNRQQHSVTCLLSQLASLTDRPILNLNLQVYPNMLTSPKRLKTVKIVNCPCMCKQTQTTFEFGANVVPCHLDQCPAPRAYAMPCTAAIMVQLPMSLPLHSTQSQTYLAMICHVIVLFFLSLSSAYMS